MAKSRTATPSRAKKSPAPKATKPRAAKSTRPAKQPKQARPQKAGPPTDAAFKTANAIAHLALEKKAEDVVILDVRGLASYADYFVVMTADSDPQMSAIADYVSEKLKAQGERPIGVEGAQTGNWVLIDFGDVVAHVFYKDIRAFYDIENLWADAPRFQVKDEPRKA